MKVFPVNKPLLEKEEIAAAVQALELGWLGMGSYVGEFEKAVNNFLGGNGRYVAAVSSGTAALHLGLLAAGVGNGDEVILPSFNFVGAAQAVMATGAKPVFCDVYEDSLCINLEEVQKLISSKTKAILAVDYSCHLCDHDGLAELANERGLRIIHDAAHSFGSEHKGKRIGSFSDICAFSFDPIKTVTCIDGGIVVVRSEEELKMVQEMRVVGMMQSANTAYQNQRPAMVDVQRVGYRYHMPNLHAAIGLAQLKKIESISENRRRACKYYSEKLSLVSNISIPKSDFIDVTPFIYYIRVPSDSRNDFRDYLKEKGVGSGCHWIPIHEYTLFKQCKKGSLPVSEKVGREIVTLPLYSDMLCEDIDEITGHISSFFKN